MAKSKRKVLNTQRDKTAIETAKYLKSIGALSKQAKLHGGKYVSRSVLKKTREFGYLRDANFTTIKAPKRIVQKAKEEGLLVINNRIVAPKGDQRFASRVRRGIPMGIAPVPGGHIERVVLPYSDLWELMAAAEKGELDQYKLPGENFAFSLYGNQSYQPFRDSRHFYEYLKRYDGIFNQQTGEILAKYATDNFRGLEVFRMVPGSWSPPGMTERRQAKRDRARQRAETQDRRYAERRAKKWIAPATRERLAREDAEKKRNQYAKLKSEGSAAYQAKLEKGRERARRSYLNRKPKKD